MMGRFRVTTVACLMAASTSGASCGSCGDDEPPPPQEPAPQPKTDPSGTQVGGAPAADKVVELPAPAEGDLRLPAIVVDVHQPARIWRALRNNEWTKQAMQAPLGRGFAQSWSAFFGTHGEDLAASFKGTVLDLLVDRVFAQPFSVVWFRRGGTARGAPVVVVPAPDAPAVAAFSALEEVAVRGRFAFAHCPAAKVAVNVSRWLIADHAVYAGRKDDRIVLGRNPHAVMNGLCGPLATLRADEQTAVEIAVHPDALGRDAQLLAHLLGLSGAPRLAFGIQGDRLQPRGIRGELATSTRIGSGELPATLLALVPEDIGVVLALQLKLPARMTKDTLRTYLSGGEVGDLRTWPVAALWEPHGNHETDVALILPPGIDRAAIDDAFDREWTNVCGHYVLASRDALRERLRAACERRLPSILAGPPAVVAGMKAESSVTLGIGLGRVLSTVTYDAYWDEHHGKPAHKARRKKAAPLLPPEVDTALRALEALPFVGLRGTADGRALAPGGFRS